MGLGVAVGIRVERPACAVAGEGELGPGAARGDDLAVGLKRDRGCAVADRPEGRVQLSVGVEAGIEGAVVVVAGEGEVEVECAAADVGRSRDDDLAVGLKRHRACGVEAVGADVGAHLAVGVEVRPRVGVGVGVEGAVRVVAGEGEVAVAAARAGTGDHDLVVAGLERDAVGGVKAFRVEVGGYLAVGVEPGIEGAIGVVAGQGEVALAAARDDNLAVVLKRDGCGGIAAVRADIGPDYSPVAEAGVQAAVGVVSGHDEVLPVASRDHQLPVALLDREAADEAACGGGGANAGSQPAVAVKGGVAVAGRREGRPR